MPRRVDLHGRHALACNSEVGSDSFWNSWKEYIYKLWGFKTKLS